jgi:Tol biopolymer transport system component
VEEPGELKPGQNPRRRLYIHKLDEKGPGTDLGVETESFVWSPDGTEIACTLGEFGGEKAPETTHTVINVTTKAKTALKIPSGHIITDWSRDGKFFLTMAIAVKDEKPSARLYLMNRDGTEHKALTDETQLSMMGKMSPDGNRVLFVGVTLPAKDKPVPPKRDMMVLDIATGKTTKVEDVPLNAELQGYCWSPDGKKIAYSWREVHEGKPEDLINKETESHVIVSDPDGKNAKTILTEKGAGQWHVTIGGMDWR